jgi:hypothetical protein
MSWYSWNNREWGTKWDVAVSDEDKYPETYVEGPVVNGENKVVYYNFNTAWSPPVPAIEKLSAQYPTLLFTLSYKEEQGWGGEAEILRGGIISHSQYDNQCYECDEEYTDEEYMAADTCEDCYGVCPKCGWSGDFCQTHEVEYNLKNGVEA